MNDACFGTYFTIHGETEGERSHKNINWRMEVHPLPTTKCALVSSVHLPSLPISTVRAQYGSHHIETKYFLYFQYMHHIKGALLCPVGTCAVEPQLILQISE